MGYMYIITSLNGMFTHGSYHERVSPVTINVLKVIHLRYSWDADCDLGIFLWQYGFDAYQGPLRSSDLGWSVGGGVVLDGVLVFRVKVLDRGVLNLKPEFKGGGQKCLQGNLRRDTKQLCMIFVKSLRCAWNYLVSLKSWDLLTWFPKRK